MTTVTDNELKELKDLINSRLDRIETKIDTLESKYNSLEKSVSNIETKLDTIKPVFDKIPELSEKIGEYKNWKQISIILITGFLTSLFWAIRNTPNLSNCP